MKTNSYTKLVWRTKCYSAVRQYSTSLNIEHRVRMPSLTMEVQKPCVYIWYSYGTVMLKFIPGRLSSLH